MPPGEPIIMHLLQKYWIFQLYKGPSVLCRFSIGTLNKMGAPPFFFSLGSWGETEAVPSLEFPQAAGTYHSATIQFSHTKHPLLHSPMSWHKKHTHVPSKGKCHANDTFPTRCGICCGQDKPEGSGYTQTGTFQQSGVFHS